MKTEEQNHTEKPQSAFMLRAKEMTEELNSIKSNADDGVERSFIIIVNEKLPDGDHTTQHEAMSGSTQRLIKSLANFLENPENAQIFSIDSGIAAMKKIAER